MAELKHLLKKRGSRQEVYGGHQGSPNNPVRSCPPKSLPFSLDVGSHYPIREGMGQEEEGRICFGK